MKTKSNKRFEDIQLSSYSDERLNQDWKRARMSRHSARVPGQLKKMRGTNKKT